MIKVIREHRELSDIKDAWIALYPQCVNVTPFQMFGYIYFVCDTIKLAQQELYIITVFSKQKELLAIFPCCLKKGELRFICAEHSDFCDALVRRDFIVDYHLYKEVTDFILGDKQISSVRLLNIRKESPLLPYFCFFLKGALVYPCNAFSMIKFSSDTKSTDFVRDLSALTSKERYRLKNIIKKAENSTLLYYKCDTSENFPDAVCHIIREMIEKGERSMDYFNQQMLDLFRKLYSQGLVDVAVTTLEGTPIAASLLFNAQDEQILWTSVYLEKQYNLWNVLQIIERLHQTNRYNLNLARGTYKYKIHNFRPIIENLYCLHYSKGVFGKILNLIQFDLYQIKQIIKSFLNRK